MGNIRALSLALVALLGALSSTSKASDLIYSQPADSFGRFGPITKTITNNSIDGEAADDFDLVGTVDRVVIHPLRTWAAGPSQVDGVIIRFYAWTSSGPGALQQEQLIPSGPKLNVNQSTSMDPIDATLNTPFNATGKHFISVQIKTDEPMNWWTANSGAPHGSRAYVRNRLTSTTWTAASTSNGAVDGSFELYGTVVGDPVITQISPGTLPRSGRLIIDGKYFGSNVGQVVIDGKQAIISGWSQSRVKAYVPESASLGTVTVKVIGDNGITNEVPLSVTTRQSEGRIKWKFKVDNQYTTDVPVVSPDGTIYINAEYAIYALTPNGGLKWIFSDLPWVDRIDVGPDGTLYTSSNDIVYAINPDGTVKWIFDPPFAGNFPNTMDGPNVGPDGNIYMVHGSTVGGLGVFSLNPQGQLRWRYEPLVGERYPESRKIAFTPGRVHVSIEHEENGTTSPFMNEVLTLGLDGSFKWRRQQVSTSSLAAGTNADVYALMLETLTALTSTGAIRWQVPATEVPTVGPDGTVYTLRNGGLYQVALDPLTGNDKWALSETFHTFYLHRPAPNNSVLMGSGYFTEDYSPTSFKPFIQAVSIDGKVMWRQFIPNENDNPQYPGYGYIQPKTPTFSNDSSTAYYGSLHNASFGSTAYTYVYAVDTGTGSTPDPITNAGVVSQSVPVSLIAGQSYTVKVSIKNTGNTTWTAGTYYLGAVGATTDFGRPKVELNSGESVAPGATKNFSFTIWAPMTAGDYFLQYRMVGPNGFFGQATGAVYPQVATWAHAARYLSQTVPTTVKAGSTFTVSVKMRNVGTKTWNAAEAFMLRSTGTTFGTSNVTLGTSERIARGQDKTFTFTCTAPATPGNYTMKWRMYRASTYNQFFGDTTTAKTITVVP